MVPEVWRGLDKRGKKIQKADDDQIFTGMEKSVMYKKRKKSLLFISSCRVGMMSHFDITVSSCRLQRLHVSAVARVLDSLALLQKSLSSEWGEIIMR